MRKPERPGAAELSGDSRAGTTEAMDTDKPAEGSEPAAPGTDPAVPDSASAPEASEDTSGDSAAAALHAVPTLGDVLLAAEELWPESLAEGWDAVGLVAGRPSRPVERILFAVDPTTEVIDEAIEWGADLLLTHHPLFLKPVHSVAGTGFKGDAVHRLIEGGCALLTVHTNGDSAVGGVSDVLADAFGLGNVEPLVRAEDGLPEEGIGRVGDLRDATTLADFAKLVFSIMPAVAGGVRVAGDPHGLVRRVAVCGGAGDSLFDAVRRHQADVYVTADLRHHPASELRERALAGK